MAALLMKHIEKEKRKLLAVTPSSSSSNSSSSSSVKTSVKTFHTQKGQYTVHFGAGQSASTSGRLLHAALHLPHLNNHQSFTDSPLRLI